MAWGSGLAGVDLGSREYRWPGYLLALLVVALALEALAYAYSLHKHPYAPPCRACGGGGKTRGFWPRAFGLCPRCGDPAANRVSVSACFQPGRYAGMTRR